MNILYVSAEVEPFAKSGGLGDVIGALPKSVAKLGNNVTVVMPLYCDVISKQYQEQMQYVGYYYTDVNWRHQYVGVMKLIRDGVTYYFLDNKFYFCGPMYCYADNERFAFFAKATLDLVCYLNQKVDVIHCNDWSTGLIPILLHAYFRGNDCLANTKTVFTIHNLRYQGKMGKSQLQDLTGLSNWYFAKDRLTDGGCVNIIKGAIVFADTVTTVSPTYAQEIGTSYYGEGLESVINSKRYKLCGIINGVDYSLYNPQKDGLIACKYSAHTSRKGKIANKVALQKELSLPVDENVPLIGIVSRLVDQKGLDLVEQSMERILQHKVQLVVLGTGESRYEFAFRNFAERYPDKVSANILFNNTLAHKVYSACDFVLVPSAFEPCGLTQLIGLKYGAIPIVRETGGLKDTVTSYNEQTLQGNGFSFANYNADDFAYTVERALDYYHNKRNLLEKIRKVGMRCDYSWTASSAKYLELYNKLING